MPEFHLHPEYWHGDPRQPTGIKTKLGWVLFRDKGYHKYELNPPLKPLPTS